MSIESIMTLLAVPADRQGEFVAIFNSQTTPGMGPRAQASLARIIWEMLK